MWHDFSSALSAIFSVLALILALFAARGASPGWGSQRRKLRSLDSRIESCEESCQSLTEELLRVANSQKMQRVRAATTHATGNSRLNGEPDPATHPNEWRDWKNKQLKTGVVN